MATIRDIVRSKVQDAMWDSFAEGYCKAYDLYERDKLYECIKWRSDLLEEEVSIRRYIRIGTLILLALVVKEEADFRDARSEAGIRLCMPRNTKIMLMGC
jgi:hypothetical protein